jgi:hypothetical protein
MMSGTDRSSFSLKIGEEIKEKRGGTICNRLLA